MRAHKTMLCSLLLVSGPLFGAGANVFIQHNLVADTAGVADVTDPKLVNPWGISESATGPFWVSNAGSGTSTLYNGSGTIIPLVVTVPAAASGQTGTPTGQVVNSVTSAFQLANGRGASFIFASEDGVITAWNGGTTAAIMVNNSSTAVYKGLATGTSSNGPMLYAANFKSGKIDVFDGKFQPATVSGGFTNANVPAGFAPFNIWPQGGKLYVAYAKQASDQFHDAPGAGNGFLASFDFDGNLQKQLVSNGALNSPWGIALAPSTFGAFAGDLLIGNFGDGKINAFDPTSGNLLGTLQDSTGNPIVISGLWALLFGNSGTGGDKNTLYFTAGPGGQQHGLLGSIAPPAAILGIQNGASQVSGPVVPGEVLILTGLTIGPSPTSSAVVPASGKVGGSLGGASVTFNGTAAPILYTSASQTSVLVPYEIAGSTTANISVAYRGQTATKQAPVAASAPGVFTLNYSGSGQIVALNIDDTVNQSSNPAAAGSEITFFATGVGLTNPTGEDGVVDDQIVRTPQLSVTVSIGGQNAQVTYSGSASNLVQGVTQIQAVIPNGVTGTVPVVLTVGSSSSQANATISVK